MKKFKPVVTLALAVIFCFSLRMTALAAEPAETCPAVHISKDLNIAVGTTTPNAAFTFTFTPDTANSIGLQDSETCPAIADKTLTYSASVTDADQDGVISLTTDDILDDVTFAHAGVYAYTIAESAAGFANTETETMTYDSNTYTLRVYVENDENGGIKISGATVTDNTGKNKENLTDDGTGVEGETTTDNTGNDDYGTNGLRFSNTYTKLSGSDDDGDGNTESIKISKTVAGNYGDKTKEFSFTLNVAKAVTDTTSTEYTYVLTKDGVETTAAAAYGSDVSFTLTHEDTLVVENLVAGATYDISENGEANYKPSAVVNGVETDDKTFGDSLAFTDVAVDENGSGAAYTNTYKDSDVIPTGVVINNLPFVMLVVLAITGMFFFVLSGKRRAQEP